MSKKNLFNRFEKICSFFSRNKFPEKIDSTEQKEKGFH